MESYDYIIVGAGSAGCVLANRLSANPELKICLIEAGKPANSLLVKMPAGVGNLIKKENEFNWGFSTVPQQHLNKRRLWWPRGRGIGGSSLINGMIYIRGHARDYDQWRQSGLRGWGYDDVLPYFKRSEAYQGAPSDYHGADGEMNITDSPLGDQIYDMFLKAGEQAGYQATEDFNGANQEGFGRYQRNIYNGERQSASLAFLSPSVQARPNLTIKSAALVSRVLFRGGKTYGIELVKKRGGVPDIVLTNREVLLSAGCVQSPQLLMLSGIGPADKIKAAGITSVFDSPNVGRNLQDHLNIPVIHKMTRKLSAYSRQKGIRKLFVALKYMMSKSGAGADNFLQVGAFLKSRTGLNRPDLQLHVVNAIIMDHAKTLVKADGFTVEACQLRPESRGTIGLASADPFDHPLIDPNYLATEADRQLLRDSVKLMREICAQSAFDDLRGDEFMPGNTVQSDAQIDAYIREHSETIYHPVGTAAMGIRDEDPVAPDLTVRGVEGLRVIDASVMPTLIGGNTNAPTLMIAEKAADMILGKPAPQPVDASNTVQA